MSKAACLPPDEETASDEITDKLRRRGFFLADVRVIEFGAKEN